MRLAVTQFSVWTQRSVLRATDLLDQETRDFTQYSDRSRALSVGPKL